MVDIANVMGSRPDGWWKDRAGAAGRLMTSLVPLAGGTVSGPDSPDPLELARIIAVVEGQSRQATVPAELDVVRAPGDGDSSIVSVAEQVLATGEVALVVTADRELKKRLPVGARVAGPAWLLGLVAP